MTTYAIVETGGKQLWAEPGRFYYVERLDAEPESTVEISEVLLVNHEGEVSLGQPYVSNAVVTGRVMNHCRGEKVIVYKMKPKKKTRKKNGHRQELTQLMIESISVNGNVVASAE